MAGYPRSGCKGFGIQERAIIKLVSMDDSPRFAAIQALLEPAHKFGRPAR